MTTTRWITFHIDKNGFRYATQFSGTRNIRIALADAEFAIASGTGTEEPEVKW